MYTSSASYLKMSYRCRIINECTHVLIMRSTHLMASAAAVNADLAVRAATEEWVDMMVVSDAAATQSPFFLGVIIAYSTECIGTELA